MFLNVWLMTFCRSDKFKSLYKCVQKFEFIRSAKGHQLNIQKHDLLKKNIKMKICIIYVLYMYYICIIYVLYMYYICVYVYMYICILYVYYMYIICKKPKYASFAYRLLTELLNAALFLPPPLVSPTLAGFKGLRPTRRP